MFLTTHLMEEAERLCDRVAIIDHGRIIDIDTPAELVRRHCPERTVVVATDGRRGRERFRAMPACESVQRRTARLTIRGRGDDFVTQVIQCLAEHRIPVTDFRTELPTLEDVFLKLTGHSIRELRQATMLRGLWRLTWLEIKIFLREPLGVIGTVGFPVLLFVVLGRMFGRGGAGPRAAPRRSSSASTCRSSRRS